MQSKHEKHFRKDFYHYINAELKEKNKSKMEPERQFKEQVTESLRDIYAGSNCEHDMSWWNVFDPPTVDLSTDPIRPVEVRKTVSRMSNLSAPGPDGIQPLIIKKLPSLQHVLATLFTRLISSNVVPKSWQKGTMIFLHKKGDKNDISNYRPLTLTSVICKVFHSLLNRRLTSFLIDNGYINRNVQKGFLKGVKGCTEHSLVLSNLLNAIRRRKHSAHVVWLDIANAFGSVPHNVLIAALESMHVPPWLTNYIRNF